MKVVFVGECPEIEKEMNLPMTIGSIYDGKELKSKFHLIVIEKMDNGQWGTFPINWFKPLDEQRSDIINKVLK